MKTAWSEWFLPHILARGRQYYREDRVSKICYTDGCYTASVEGTEWYEVCVYTNGDQIEKMTCTCPYAMDGSYCKHMAAVLFALEDGDEEQGITITVREPLETLIPSIPREKLDAFVLEVAKRDPHIRGWLYDCFSNEKVDESQWEYQIDDIIDCYADRSGYIDYYHAREFQDEMERFVREQMYALMQKQEYVKAFACSWDILRRMDTLEIDDSDGISSTIVYICMDYWESLLSQCEPEDAEKIFAYLENGMTQQEYKYCSEEIESFMMEHFQEEEFLERKLRMIDAAIADPAMDAYHKKEKIVARLDLMNQLHMPRAEQETFRAKYRSIPEVRQYEIREVVQAGDLQQAIAMLRESKEEYKDNLYQARICSEQLIQLYEQTGQKELQKQELIFLIMHCRQDDVQWIFELKKLCAQDEWETLRDQYLQASTCQWIRLKVLEREGLYQRLLDEILSEPIQHAIYQMMQYESILRSYAPEAVRDVMIQYLNWQAEHVGNRKMYAHMMGYMKKLAAYPNGRTEAKKLAADWKQTYRRRPAMMDELRKAGF